VLASLCLDLRGPAGQSLEVAKRRFLSSPSDHFPGLADDAEVRFEPCFPAARPSRQRTAHRRTCVHQVAAVLALASDKFAQCVLIQVSHLSSTRRQSGERILHLGCEAQMCRLRPELVATGCAASGGTPKRTTCLGTWPRSNRGLVKSSIFSLALAAHACLLFNSTEWLPGDRWRKMSKQTMTSTCWCDNGGVRARGTRYCVQNHAMGCFADHMMRLAPLDLASGARVMVLSGQCAFPLLFFSA